MALSERRGGVKVDDPLSAAGVVIIREHVHRGQQLVGVDERTANDERA